MDFPGPYQGRMILAKAKHYQIDLWSFDLGLDEKKDL